MEKCLIVAVAKNGVIGRDGGLPWKELKDDMKHFRETTMNVDVSRPHAVVMGRNTWNSIPAQFRPLPKRLNIVISSTLRKCEFAGVTIVATLAEAYEMAKLSLCQRAFVIGGAQLYREALKDADVAFVTHVYVDAEGDVRLPELNELRSPWGLVQSLQYKENERNAHMLNISTYERRF